MMKKQTAVEWSEGEFNKYYAFSREEMQTFNRIFNQAKQMEREQIEEAYKADLHPCSDEDAEQYYNETYSK